MGGMKEPALALLGQGQVLLGRAVVNFLVWQSGNLGGYMWSLI